MMIGLLAALISGCGTQAVASGVVSAPSSQPSASPVALAVPSPVPSATPLTEAESRTLMREFVRAQRSEVKALEHRQRTELTELKQSQKVTRKEWEQREKTARHKFFEENEKGPERRVYVKAFLKRGDDFRAAQKSELNERKKQHAQALSDLKAAQAKRLKEVEGLLRQHIRPAESLWPAAGR